MTSGRTAASIFGDEPQTNTVTTQALIAAPPLSHIPAPLKRKATDTQLETITVDPMYDLTVIVGTPEHSHGQKAFQINKGSLRNVSPVWTKMLSGIWKESNLSEINFPEDNCNAFLIVLQIAHFQFYQLPENPSVSDLVELALLTDKYELEKAVCVGLKVKKWMEPYHKPGDTWPSDTMLQEFTIITTAFQMQKDSQYLSNQLAMEIQVNETGNYYLEDEKCNKVKLRSDMLPKVTEEVDRIRQEVLSAWIASCTVGFSETINTTLSPCGATLCAATKTGVLLNALKTAGFYPSPPNTQVLRRSVISYWQDLKDIGTKFKPYRCKGTSKDIGTKFKPYRGRRNFRASSYSWAGDRVSCSFEKCFGDFGVSNEVRATFKRHAHKDMWNIWQVERPAVTVADMSKKCDAESASDF